MIEEHESEGEAYRFSKLKLRTVLADMRFSGGAPGPGDNFPEFDLEIVSGDRLRTADLRETGPALFIFGSMSCPMTDSAAPGLNELHERFGDRVRFVMVNVREGHPGEALPQGATMAAKRDRAAELARLHGFKFEVAVDDIDGSLHRALSPKPNSAYLVGKDGVTLFRAHWASDSKALGEALEAVVAGTPLSRATSGGLIRPMLRMLPYLAPALDRAGKGAWHDLWRVAPPLAAMASLLKLLRLGRRPSRAGAAGGSGA